MGTDLEVAKVWMMKEWRQLLVDILVEGINSSCFTGAILQDTFQLAEAGLYWILLLSTWIQLTTSKGQPWCWKQKKAEPRTLHYSYWGSLLLQMLDFAFLGPPSLQSICTSSENSSWKHVMLFVLLIEPLSTRFWSKFWLAAESHVKTEMPGVSPSCLCRRASCLLVEGIFWGH